MPILAQYEVNHDGKTIELLLTEKDAAKVGGKLLHDSADVDHKMRAPQNKARTPERTAHDA